MLSFPGAASAICCYTSLMGYYRSPLLPATLLLLYSRHRCFAIPTRSFAGHLQLVGEWLRVACYCRQTIDGCLQPLPGCRQAIPAWLQPAYGLLQTVSECLQTVSECLQLIPGRLQPFPGCLRLFSGYLQPFYKGHQSFSIPIPYSVIAYKPLTVLTGAFGVSYK